MTLPYNHARIGIAGTGRMGTAIAQRLLDSEVEVQVWNRTPDRASAAVQAGASMANTPAELATSCGTVITSIMDYNASNPSAVVTTVTPEIWDIRGPTADYRTHYRF